MVVRRVFVELTDRIEIRLNDCQWYFLLFLITFVLWKRANVSRQAPGKRLASPWQAPRFSGKPLKPGHFYLEKTEV